MKAVMAALVFACMASTSPAQPQHTTRISFDKFKDQTTFWSEETKVFRDSTTGMTMTGGFLCEGRVVICNPSYVSIAFIGMSDEWRFLKTHEVIFLIDGKRQNTLVSTWDSKIIDLIPFGPPIIKETVITPITTEAFKRLANAKTVEVQIGSIEFSLTEKSLSSLKDTLKYMVEINEKEAVVKPEVKPEEKLPDKKYEEYLLLFFAVIVLLFIKMFRPNHV